MVRFAVVCAGVMALAMAGCAKEPAEEQAPVTDAALPPPPLTTEMVGGTDPAAQPATPTPAPAATTAPGAPQGATTTSPTTPAPATAAPATADTSHTAHADSGHTGH
jgi:hypothetical protein